MRHNIHKEYYKSLYFALFESHMTYYITVFGHANKKCVQKLFKVQKHCIRILFGDLDEHTKPLFHKLGILAFKNL